MAKKMFNKYGLSGDSGLFKEYNENISIIHIASNYGINTDEEVFVICYYDNLFKSHKPNQSRKHNQDYWSRMKKDYAAKRGYQIIRCCKCDRPAVSLDHHYPYYIDGNKCKKHYKE